MYTDPFSNIFPPSRSTPYNPHDTMKRLIDETLSIPSIAKDRRKINIQLPTNTEPHPTDVLLRRLEALENQACVETKPTSRGDESISKIYAELALLRERVVELEVQVRQLSIRNSEEATINIQKHQLPAFTSSYPPNVGLQNSVHLSVAELMSLINSTRGTTTSSPSSSLLPTEMSMQIEELRREREAWRAEMSRQRESVVKELNSVTRDIVERIQSDLRSSILETRRMCSDVIALSPLSMSGSGIQPSTRNPTVAEEMQKFADKMSNFSQQRSDFPPRPLASPLSSTSAEQFMFDVIRTGKEREWRNSESNAQGDWKQTDYHGKRDQIQSEQHREQQAQRDQQQREQSQREQQQREQSQREQQQREQQQREQQQKEQAQREQQQKEQSQREQQQREQQQREQAQREQQQREQAQRDQQAQREQQQREQQQKEQAQRDQHAQREQQQREQQQKEQAQREQREQAQREQQQKEQAQREQQQKEQAQREQQKEQAQREQQQKEQAQREQQQKEQQQKEQAQREQQISQVTISQQREQAHLSDEFDTGSPVHKKPIPKSQKKDSDDSSSEEEDDFTKNLRLQRERANRGRGMGGSMSRGNNNNAGRGGRGSVSLAGMMSSAEESAIQELKQTSKTAVAKGNSSDDSGDDAPTFTAPPPPVVLNTGKPKPKGPANNMASPPKQKAPSELSFLSHHSESPNSSTHSSLFDPFKEVNTSQKSNSLTRSVEDLVAAYRTKQGGQVAPKLNTILQQHAGDTKGDVFRQDVTEALRASTDNEAIISSLEKVLVKHKSFQKSTDSPTMTSLIGKKVPPKRAPLLK